MWVFWVGFFRLGFCANLGFHHHHHSPLSRRRWVWGVSGGGLYSHIRSKQGHVCRNAAVSLGRCHRSKGDSSVGCSGHEKRCWVVRSACRQHGQVGAGNRPIRCLRGPFTQKKTKFKKKSFLLLRKYQHVADVVVEFYSYATCVIGGLGGVGRH